jgi:gamma-glutamylaminecyclotransferase
MGNLVFVYGTLKKGFPNHAKYMGTSKLLGNYRTVEKYPLFLTGERYVPCMVNRPGVGYQVEGEIYDVDDDTLKMLDALERTNQPDGYTRQMIRFIASDRINSDQREAHVYLTALGNTMDQRSAYLKSYGLEAAKKYKPRQV